MQDWNRVFGIGVRTDHIGTTLEPIWVQEFCHISGNAFCKSAFCSFSIRQLKVLRFHSKDHRASDCPHMA
jgi:hypothetical protein